MEMLVGVTHGCTVQVHRFAKSHVSQFDLKSEALLPFIAVGATVESIRVEVMMSHEIPERVALSRVSVA